MSIRVHRGSDYLITPPLSHVFLYIYSYGGRDFDPLFLSGVIKTSYTEVTIFKAVNNTGNVKLDFRTVAWTRSLDIAWPRSLDSKS